MGVARAVRGTRVMRVTGGFGGVREGRCVGCKVEVVVFRADFGLGFMEVVYF